MQIWVDADACPKPVKDILYRAAERVQIPLNLVANQALRVIRSPFVRCITVAPGLDVADNRIVLEMSSGDIVVTADVPLAAEVVQKGGIALNPRGELYTEQNIGEHLAVRDFLDQLRGSGVVTGGPETFGHKERQAFANQLDRLLAEYRRTSPGGPAR